MIRMFSTKDMDSRIRELIAKDPQIERRIREIVNIELYGDEAKHGE